MKARLLLFLMSTCGLGHAEAAGASDPSPAEAASWTWLRSLRSPEVDRDSVARELSSLGQSVVDPLFSILEARRIPDPADPGGEAQLLSEPQTEALLGALSGVGRRTAWPVWTARFEEAEGIPSRTAAILALGAIGEANDLQVLFELALESTGSEPSPRLIPCVEGATRRLLLRDDDGFSELEATWAGIPHGLLPCVVRAVGLARDSRGLALLADVISWTSEHERLIAAQVPLLGPSNDVDVNRRLASSLLPLLRSDSKEDAQAACLALGHLEGFEVVSDLIELLGDERPGTAATAHHALRTLTGKQLVQDARPWRRWLKEEQRWMREARAHEITLISANDELLARKALREIARHRYERHDLAMAVSPTLFDESEELRVLAAGVLHDLGSRWGAHDLRLALEDPSEAVRTAAHAALVRIAGEDAGWEAEAWEEFDFPRPSH